MNAGIVTDQVKYDPRLCMLGLYLRDIYLNIAI